MNRLRVLAIGMCSAIAGFALLDVLLFPVAERLADTEANAIEQRLALSAPDFSGPAIQACERRTVLIAYTYQTCFLLMLPLDIGGVADMQYIYHRPRHLRSSVDLLLGNDYYFQELLFGAVIAHVTEDGAIQRTQELNNGQ